MAQIALNYSVAQINAAIAKINSLVTIIEGNIVQLYDGTTAIYPRTKAEAVFFDNDTSKTLNQQFSQLEQEQIQGGVYDVSAHNNSAVFESLSALLSNANLSTLIPTSVRCGGMSIRFIQGSVPNSDNKYVQVRLMANSFTTDVTKWQTVDDEPTAGNENLVKGSGCNRIIYNNQLVSGYYSGYNKNIGDTANTSITASDIRKCFKFKVFKGEILCLYTKSSSNVAGYVRTLILTDNNNYITYITAGTTDVFDYTQNPLIYTVENDGFAYIECNTDSVEQFKCYINKSSHLDYYVGVINSQLSNNNLLMNFVFNNSLIKTINNSNQLLKTGAIGNTAETEPTSFYNYGYIKESCNEGDVYYVNTQGGQNGRAFAFCDSNNIVLLSSAAAAAVDGIIIAPKNSSYIVVNNDFFYQSTPNLVKLNSGCIYYLYSLILNMETEIEGIVKSKDLNYDSYVNDYFINLNGNIQSTQQSNRQINTYSVTKGRYKITRNEGNSFTRGYRLLDMYNQVIALGPVGGTESMVTNYLDVNISKGKLEVFFLTVGTCEVTYISKVEQALEPVNEEISECNKKATNVGGLYLANNKILLSGASISTEKNGYFEYAMEVLGVQGANISVAGTNIYYLAYRLYSNPSGFDNDDVLIISHVHNFNVFDLPLGKEAYSVSDYENDSFLGDYIKTTDYYTGNLVVAGGYTADELYAMGYDYVLKKWAKICYDLKDTAGYNSVFGKPCQIVLYTYWHDARVAYNTSIRKLAKKWGFLLIKDDENIGFSKSQVNPATNQQWSILYGDTTGWAPTEYINGIRYGFHPNRMTDENCQLWQNSGVLLQSYLPYIQKIRAAILINTLKDAIMKPE